jgi:hypothetical protein
VGGSVGGHCRHLHDHFERLRDQLVALSVSSASSASSAACVDYDRRDRMTAFETDLSVARENIAQTTADLAEVVERGVEDDPSGYLRRPMSVRFLVSGETVPFDTTIGRELSFVQHHAFHHASSMKLIAKVGGFEDACPLDFGMAPSTMNFLNAKDI